MIPALRRLRGLVLHRTPVREKDRIVDVFTREEGRLRLFAPGVRHVASRRAGNLEPFMESQLVVARSRRGDTIREARALRAFPRLREHLNRVQVAYTVVDLLRGHTGEGTKDHLLYDAMLCILRALDAPTEPSGLLGTSAHVHVLRAIGGLPDLRRCSRCRAPLVAGGFSAAGTRGFLCVACGGKEDPWLTDVVKVLRFIIDNPAPARSVQLTPAVARRLWTLLRSLLRSQAVRVAVHSWV